MAIYDEVRAGMDRGELFLEYLPTVTLHDGRCIGAEALVRWRRNRSVLPAAAFIPSIENTPISGTLTYWVLDTVAQELGEWLRAHPRAHVSINVPPEILGRGGLGYVATHTGLNALIDQIVLEITERGVPDRLGVDALNRMAAQGVSLALDDVMMSGTNLALLTRCNFRMIKLDRQIVAQLQPDRPAPEWLGGLESLLGRTAVQVVAEGVESRHQAQTLAGVGVQLGQGYFYSASVPARGFMELYVGGCSLGRP